MGQYYQQVNLDNLEFLAPLDYGDSQKLLEFSGNSGGVMAAMAALITFTKDFRGSWAGCRLVVTGDYADEGNFVPGDAKALNLFTLVTGLDSDDERKVGGPEIAAKLPKYKQVLLQDAPESSWLKTVANVVLESSRGETKEHALSDSALTFDQPEDIFEAIGYYFEEDPDRCFSNLQQFVRISEISSKLAWQHDYASTVKTDSKTGRVTKWTVVAKSRETSKKVTTSLNFPATATEVLKFLAPS